MIICEAKQTLLTTHIKIENRDVTLYADNPFEMGRRNENAERIVFRDFPLWETNSLICNFVKSMPQLTTLTDEVFNSKAWNNVTNGASSFTNGDRYMFVKKGFDPPIPEKVSIGDYTCRVWYASRDVHCKRCGSRTHKTSETGMCDYYTPPLDHVHAFNSGPLSNFNRCAVHMGPLTFDSSEHAYQFRACEEHLRPDVAEQILHANTPREAKSIAAVIKNSDPSSHWNLVKYDVMRQVLRAKAESSEVFRQHLLDTGDKYLVESSVTDNYWGSGLSYNLTITTLPELFPGKNKLGKLLTELRMELRSHLVTDGESDHCAIPSTSVDTLDQCKVASARTHLSVIEPPTPEPTTPVLVMVPSTSDNTSSSLEHVDSNVITIKPSVKPKALSITGKLSKVGGGGTRLIRDMFKQDAKRKRVVSPPQDSSSADNRSISASGNETPSCVSEALIQNTDLYSANI